jgi:protein-S-isoprenylcysteine O-methyltransferase Ste14
MKSDATDLVDAFDLYNHLDDTSAIVKSLTGAFQPSWAPAGHCLVVGLGIMVSIWFHRVQHTMAIHANDPAAEQLLRERGQH